MGFGEDQIVLVLVLENLLTRLVPLITAPAPARLEPDATHKSHRSHKSHPWYRPYAFEHEDEHEHEDDFGTIMRPYGKQRVIASSNCFTVSTVSSPIFETRKLFPLIFP